MEKKFFSDNAAIVREVYFDTDILLGVDSDEDLGGPYSGSTRFTNLIRLDVTNSYNTYYEMELITIVKSLVIHVLMLNYTDGERNSCGEKFCKLFV